MARYRKKLVAAVAAATLLVGSVSWADTVAGDVVDGAGPTISAVAGEELDGAARLWVVRQGGAGNAVAGVTWSHATSGSCPSDLAVAYRPAGADADSNVLMMPSGWSSQSGSGSNAVSSRSLDVFTNVAITGTAPAAGSSCTLTFSGTPVGTTGNIPPGQNSFTVTLLSEAPPAPVDTTPPVVVLDVSGTEGLDGWFTSAAGVTVTATDPESAVTTVEARASADGGETWSPWAPLTGPVSLGDGIHLVEARATSAGGTSDPVQQQVRVDTTTPSLVRTIAGTPGANGWFTSDVTVSWEVSAGPSGATTCEPVTVDEDTDADGANASCDVTSGAGLTASDSTSIKRDASAPEIEVDLDGLAGTDPWFVGDVDVAFTVADPHSGVANTSQVCDGVTLDEDAVVSFTCEATNGAGLTASRTVEVKRDASAPGIASFITGEEGQDGWYTSPVTVDWVVTPGLSGATPEACTSVEVTANTDGSDVTCSTVSGAGIPASVTETIRIDQDGPQITPQVTGELGQGGWYTGDVTVAWQVVPGISGLASTDGCDLVEVTEDTAGDTFTCTATSGAGVETSASVTVKRDATGPSIDTTVTGTDGANGWYVSDVEVTRVVTWSVSGVGTTEDCGPVTVDEDTTGTTLTCRATSPSGLNAEDVVTVKRDATPPTITATRSPAPNANGWHDGPVTVSFTCDDATSGVATCAADVLLEDDGADQSASGTATDQAGNTATVTESGIDIDSVPPVVTVDGGPADDGAYVFGEVPPAPTCTATDELSGVTDDGCTVDGYSEQVGEHTLTFTAEDLAGNRTVETRSYEVLAWRLDGFHRPVDANADWNVVKGGSTVPLKFNVVAGDRELTDTSAVRSLALVRVTCTAGSQEVVAEEVVATTGQTQLRYAGNEFLHNWKVPNGKDACYRMSVITQDGSVLSANFKLR